MLSRTSPSWNPPSFTVELTLSSPCSCADLSLSRHGAALAGLYSVRSDALVIWSDSYVSFGKGDSGVLANCSLCALRPLFPFRQAQLVQVFPLKPAPLCKLSAGLSNTDKYATSLLFSSSQTLTQSSSPSFLLPPSLYYIWQELSSLSSYAITLQWVPGHSFLPGIDAVNELARRGALLLPSAVACSVSPFISHIHSCLFSDWRHSVSSKFFDTQIPSVSTEEFVLPRCTRCSLSSSLQRTQPSAKLFISLELAKARILYAAPAVI